MSSKHRDRDDDRHHRHHNSKSSKKKPQTAFFEMSAKRKDNEDDEEQPSSEEEQEIRTEKVEVDDQARLKDIEERDEFAERLKARDEQNTKRKVDQQNNKMLEEAAKRLKLEKEDRSKVMPSLREQSRQHYLERREVDKLAELEQEVMDEEFMFKDVKLTAFERQRFEQKKRTLESARQYKEADKLEKVDRYYIPDDKTSAKNKPADKYAEDIREKGQNFEARKWEEEQASQAIMKFGARDAKEKLSKDEKNYEYLLEDEIDFVKSMRIPGKNHEAKNKDFATELEEANKSREKKTMKETRESLPIFAYRNSLLEAIREHQVIIIEGELQNLYLILATCAHHYV